MPGQSSGGVMQINVKAIVTATMCLVLSTTHSATAQSNIGKTSERVDNLTSYDVVVYGGTSSGLVAAVQAKRMGKTVVVLEPSDRMGGLTTGGLGQTDIGNKAAIGGISREFYQSVRKHYENSESWTWEEREEYQNVGQSKTRPNEEAMWTFEPSAALKIFDDWMKRDQIDVRYNQRLDRTSGVTLTDSKPWKIVSIQMETGTTYRGNMFIDATYEGDLMAAAKVTYTIGRESKLKYDESLNGVQVAQARHHQLKENVSPFVIANNPSSGILPFIDPGGPGNEGGEDHRIQAYCFRMCLTDRPENRIPFHKPDPYNEQWFELLLRNFEAGEVSVPWIHSAMPNRKSDSNNRLGVSTDFIGQNYNYPEGSYAERDEIVGRHLLYQQGLMWTLANHVRVPEIIRDEVSRWGVCKDEFVDRQGWQRQLYIREARRMVSDYVMTQNNCQRQRTATDSVGLAAYTMDSHHVQRYIDSHGHVRNEGDVEVGGFAPFPISYRSIVPKKRECTNLLVPVCLSSSHMAFGSIRMEPVFMVLGQSAATAACQAIDEKTSVQEIDVAKLQQCMATNGQILEWSE